MSKKGYLLYREAREEQLRVRLLDSTLSPFLHEVTIDCQETANGLSLVISSE